MTVNNQKSDKYYQDLDYVNFDEFLCEYHNGALLQGVYEFGFEKPSIIQSKAINPILDKRDLIAQAQSGSGKTGAFAIGVLGIMDISKIYPQAVIIGNTRELALQIFGVIQNIGKHLNIKVVLCTGSSGNDKNQKNKGDAVENLLLAEQSQILICTPGRLCDLINRNEKKEHKNKLLGKLKILVFDEADILLGNNFIEQTYEIIKKIPTNTQICLFSATYPQEILDLTSNFMRNPVNILIERENIRVDLIKNFYVSCEYEENKYDILFELYEKITICQAVIFVNTKQKANWIADKLRNNKQNVGVIHSDLLTTDRMEVLKKFRRTQTRILIATDVISRGIDIQQVGLVINYDIPLDPENYIHRIGRSGRYGKSGVAITFATENKKDINKMKKIELTYKIKFNELPVLEKVNDYLTGMNGYNFIIDNKNDL